MEKKLPTAKLNKAQSEPAHARAMAHPHAADLARDYPCKRNYPRTRQRREKPNREKRIAQEQVAQSKKQNRQRRLIDVSKIEMARTGDVIKLIAKITVAPVCQQVDEQCCHAEHSD
jgi:hypothetical protein